MKSFCIVALVAAVAACPARAAAAPHLPPQDQAALQRIQIRADQLIPLRLDTPLARAGKPQAIICHADAPPWRRAAERIQRAVAAATGARLPLRAADALRFADADRAELILVGNLDNNRHVARLYHNFFVCLDAGYTGRRGYVIRSVHDPWGAGHNAILVAGSYAEGTLRAADAFAKLVRAKGRPGELTLGRLLELHFDSDKRQEPPARRLTDARLKQATQRIRSIFAQPGRGRSGVALTVGHAIEYHRGGDLNEAKAYRAGLLALLHYYQTDPYINRAGLRRYDRDFRDSWTHSIAITWDLLEESGVFSDAERLQITNLIARLGLECVLYQRWDRPSVKRGWIQNRRIVHNHNTFPALGVYFVGTYLKRHYRVRYVDDWLAVAHGIFEGQKHSPKPLEDAASYQWLPLMHVMIYGMARGDWTFFDEGHAREAAKVAIMVMDNAGYQAAFGDHSGLTFSGGIGSLLQRIAWRTRDPGILWGARRAVSGVREHTTFNLAQPYWVDFDPKPPAELTGVVAARLPKQNYDSCTRVSYPTKPNLPWKQTFDKLTLRAGFGKDDEYLLLDGFGRGTHMHFDANAIIRFAAGGVPLLVDGEYIKNAPKYHCSLVILRGGQSELTPAVTGLRTAAWVGSVGVTRTFLTQYNGTEWERAMIWRPGRYLLVCDTVTAQRAGDYTLRCCWRPWGEARLQGRALVVQHPPTTLTIHNADGAALRLEKMKTVDQFPVWRLSQQVSRRLRKGESYRFVNVLAARKSPSKPRVRARVVAEGLILVRHGGKSDVLAFGPAANALPGVSEKADAALVLGDRQKMLLVRGDRVEERPASAKPDQLVAAARETAQRSAARKPVRATRLDAPTVEPAWTATRFEARAQILRVVKVTCPQPHTGRYGPVEKLVDGAYNSSTYSVMWPNGVTPVITFELPSEHLVRRVVLREWHMWKDWDIGRRQVELSSDGFRRDVRKITAPFRPAGAQRWGSNVNTLMAVEVNQRARQVRLTVSPARKNSRVYLAEVEVLGAQPGAAAEIRALAVGRLGKDGAAGLVAGCDTGAMHAFAADGSRLWTWRDDAHATINSLACADVDGDGGDEVMAAAGERLILLGSDGRSLWSASPPEYRGIQSDVMTVFPAKLDGERPAVVCGCRSWQYFAYDATGRQLWRHVIYAHSATAGCAADFDADGRDEILAGNAYYRLNLIDDNGRRLTLADRFGPEQTAVAAADLDRDGRAEALVGTDGGELLCFDAKGRRVWTANVGDRVTRIIVRRARGAMRIYCAAESAHVFCLDARGEILWRRALPDGAYDLAIAAASGRSRLVAAAGDAGAVVLDADGNVLGVCRASAPAMRLAALGSYVVVATRAGALEAFNLP